MRGRNQMESEEFLIVLWFRCIVLLFVFSEELKTFHFGDVLETDADKP